MKQNSLQYLLEKYREGTLNDEERVELERLTHKDEVISAANRRVTGIIWRRVSLTIAAVMVAGAGVVAVLPREAQGPLMADAQEIPTSIVEAQRDASPAVETVVPATVIEEPQHVAPLQTKHASRPATAIKRSVKVHESDPVVICNNQCEADSVLSDIRKFLSV